MNQPMPQPYLLTAPFDLADLTDFRIQPQQMGIAELADPEYARYLQENGVCFTARRHNGTIVAVVGLLDQWEGRALAWAILAHDAGDRMLALTRAIADYLDVSDYRRIEATIDVGFLQGERWAKRLGFVNETPNSMAGFYPNGHAANLYARVR